MTLRTESVSLPSGESLQVTRQRLTLDFTKSHVRYKNAAGKVVPGVTTVLGMLAKPALMRWAYEQGKAGLDFEAVRQQAADTGTVAHALIEAHLRGMDLNVANIAPDMYAQAMRAFLRWLDWWQREQLRVLHCEYPMVSERWQVGGTGDIFATRPNGSIVYIDVKSSKAVYAEFFLQCSAYCSMFTETTGQPVDECFIVRTGKAEGDELEVRAVENRESRADAFEALAIARRKLQSTGYKL